MVQSLGLRAAGLALLFHIFFFFIDDSLLFSRTTASDCVAIRDVMDSDAKASDQLVNFAKSAMCVSPSVVGLESRRLAGSMGC